MKTTIKINGLEFSFCDEDIANPDEMIAQHEYNPHSVRGWLLHDHGFTICVVFSDSLQNAIDEAVDCEKMDRYLIDMEDDSESAQWRDYAKNKNDIWDCEGLSFLGNASKPFDIESLGYVEFPAPKMSIVRLYGDKVEGLSFHVA